MNKIEDDMHQLIKLSKDIGDNIDNLNYLIENYRDLNKDLKLSDDQWLLTVINEALISGYRIVKIDSNE